ncbi:MAG: hypothetical protein RR403_00360 [Pseudoflavonifractor sp.]
MAEPQVRYFLGANSPNGFYSLYDQLLDPKTAAAIYILKGGPGCGKSSLMRRVAQTLEAQGIACQYILCSGDPESLDAVLFPTLRAAIVDGTAPHVVEPKYPGVVEHYVNLGTCYDCGGLGDIRGEIIACMDGFKGCYTRAYRCLAAAGQLREDMRCALVTPGLNQKLARRAKGILSRELKKTGRGPGGSTRRFLGAVTGRGQLCSFETVHALCNRVYELSDSYGLADGLLQTLAEGAVAAGYDVVLCPDPMATTRLAHLLVPELSLAFVTGTHELPYDGQPYRRIRLDAMADPELLRRGRAKLRFSRKISGVLMAEAVEALGEAKAKHDGLEALYNPHVDFKKVYQMADAIAGALARG